ncbi:MAG: AgmX/PglI C-terminal domain-containing protein [Pseudomonadota bacterium]
MSSVALTAPAPNAGHAKVERLRDEIIAVSRALDALELKRDTLDAELMARAGERRHYALLGSILQSLDELDREGAADLFWRSRQTGLSEAVQRAQLQSAREQQGAFDGEINAIQGQRDSIQAEIDQESLKLQGLNGGLADLEDELEAQRADFDAWRDPSEVPFRPLTMPWSGDEEEEKRYRKVMIISLCFGLLFGSVVIVFKPGARVKQEEFIPEHIAELVVKKKEEPKPEPKKETRKESEPRPDQLRPDPQRVATTVPTDSAKAAARASAQTKGVLAFSDSFAELASDDVNLGGLGEAPVSNAGRQANGGAPGSGAPGSRALITSATGTGSGGIANAGISRGGIGSGSGNSISGSGMATTVASSGVATAARAAARPGGGSGGASASGSGSGSGGRPVRTDEDIQIVFDKYKSALYRIYNRELRNDPTLRGKMVLALTIEPDGRVSACRVQSTDMNSPALSSDIVERVLKFNFGAKEGVATTKILYPIDFLPAS